MLPAFWPFLYSDRDRRVVVASCMGSHSSTMVLCVALRSLNSGVAGVRRPYVLRICDWSDSNAACDFCSASKFCATVMSTIEPEVIEGGRRIEGNSI